MLLRFISAALHSLTLHATSALSHPHKHTTRTVYAAHHTAVPVHVRQGHLDTIYSAAEPVKKEFNKSGPPIASLDKVSAPSPHSRARPYCLPLCAPPSP
jgi:hypothetical protein